MPRPIQSHLPMSQPRRNVMINKPLQDGVEEAWLMNPGDHEKTYLVKGGKVNATITGPAASQIRPVSAGKS